MSIYRWAIGSGDAPHTGARLETFLVIGLKGITYDAPHTGARLETATQIWSLLISF